MLAVYFTLLILESMWNQSTHLCIVSSLLALPEKTNKQTHFCLHNMPSKCNNMHRLWNNFTFSMVSSIFLNHLHRDTLTIQSVLHGENQVPYYIFSYFQYFILSSPWGYLKKPSTTILFWIVVYIFETKMQFFSKLQFGIDPILVIEICQLHVMFCFVTERF